MRYLLIVLMVIFHQSAARSQGILDSLLEEHYVGDKMEFYESVYTTVRYPRLARENCVMVKITATVQIDDKGSITIQQSPMMSYGFEESIHQAILQTAGKWKKNKAGVVSISFGFAIDDESIPADVVIMAYKTGHFLGCMSKEMLLEEVTKYMKKKKYKKAKKAIDQLFLRYPDSEHFQGLATVIDGNIRK